MPDAKDAVKKAINKGYVTNSEIAGCLGKVETRALAGLEDKVRDEKRLQLHDDIASAARYHTLEGTPNFFGRCYLAAEDIADKAITLTSMIGGAALGAQYQAAKAFAGTILADKLVGNYDHLLYWLGKKSVEINGLEMLNAMTQMIKATPDIVIGMGIGSLGGYFAYKTGAKTLKFIWKSFRKSRAAAKIVKKYNLDDLADNKALASNKSEQPQIDQYNQPQLKVVA